MNKIFKVVWSKTKECYVVVSEVAKNNGGKKKVLASVLATLAIMGAGVQVQAADSNPDTSANTSKQINIWANTPNKENPATPGASTVSGSGNANANDVDPSTYGTEIGIAIGAQNKIKPGNKTNAGGGSSIAMGIQNEVRGNRNVAIGTNSKTYGENSIALGTQVEAGTGHGIAIGSIDGSTATVAYGGTTPNATGSNVGNAFALAIGSGAQADGRANGTSGGIAIGQLVKATHNNTVAIGVKTTASGSNATVVGSSAEASGSSSAAYGTQSNAKGVGATAIGPKAVTDGDGAIAVGRASSASSKGSTSIGWANISSGENATSIGFSATASGKQAVAIGGGDEYYPNNATNPAGTDRAKNYTTASGESSIAIGSYAKATATSSMAFGKDANANIEGGVALGSESKTTVAAGVTGYNPADSRTNKYSTQAGAVGTSTLAAVSIGDGSNKTRQLTGLAAGTADTDAVNVAQLKNVNLKYAADTGNSDVLLKDGTLTVNGDGDLISTAVQTNGAIKVTAKKGGTITNTDGKAVKPTTNGIATTDNVADAINNSYWKATAGGNTDGTPTVGNVKPGTQVTYSAGDNLKVKQTIAANGDQEYKYSLNPVLTGITSIANTATGPKMTFGGSSINITGGSLDMGNNKITSLATGTADTDAVNVKQLKDTELHITPGTYTPDANKKVKLTYTDGNNTVVTGKEAVIDLSGLATGGTTSTEKVQKAADATGDKNIAEVGPKSGDTFGAANATYEVSVSRNAVKDAAREAVTVNNGGNTDNPISVTPTPDNTNHNTTYAVTFDGNKAAKQIPLTYKANGTGDKTVKLDKGLDFTNGTNTTAEIGNDGVVKFNLNKDVDLSNTGSLTVGGTKVNNGGVTITAPAGGTTTDVKLTNTGLDNGGNKIINVKDGDVNATSKDAVNGSQLHAVAAKERHIAPTTASHTAYTVDNNGDVTLDYVDGDGNATTEKAVIKGIANRDLSNISNAGETKIKNLAKSAIDMEDGKNTKASNREVNGVKTFKVDVEGALTDITSITNGGTNNGKISFGPNKTVTVDGDHSITLNASTGNIGGLQNKTFDPTNFTSGQAATEDQLKSVHDTLKASELHIAPTAGATNNVAEYTVDANNKVTLTYQDGNGTAVAAPKAVIDLSALANKITSGYTFNTNAIAKGGAVDGATSVKAVDNGGTINYAAGKNLTVKQEIDATNKTQTYTYSLDKDINVETVTVTGQNGKDGKIGINGKDGTNGVNGTNRVDIQVEKGVDGIDGKNGTDGISRIVYEDKTGTHTVATMDDGLKFTGNNTTIENKQKLGSLVKVQGEGTKEGTTVINPTTGEKEIVLSDGTTKFESAKDNIAVVANGTDTLTVKLNKNVKGLDSVQTKTVELGDHTTPGGTTNITYNTGDKRIEYTTPGATPGTTVTNKVATTDDIWTIQGNGTDVAPVNGKVNVKAGDNVVINTPTTADGSMTISAVTSAVYTKADGTKVYKIVDPTTNTVTFNTKPNGTGTVVPASDVIVSFQDAAGNTTGGNSIVNNVGSAIDKTGTSTGDTFLTNLNTAATNTPNAAVNVKDLKNTSDAIIGKGLKFDANVGGVKTNKLGSVVKVQGAGASADADYSGANIKTFINQTGGDTTIDVKLDKNLAGINKIFNGGSSITLNDTPSATTPAVTITGGNLSMGDSTTKNKIVNLAPGIDDNDAVNVKQLKDAKTVLADGKNTKKSGTGTAADPYKVNVEGDLTEITSITNKADASGNAGKITFSPNQTVTVNGDHNISLDAGSGHIGGLTNLTFNPNSYTSGQAATEDQLKSVHDTLKASELHIAPTESNRTGEHIAGAATSNTAAGAAANAYKYDATTKQVVLEYNDGTGANKTGTKAVIDFSALNTGAGASSWNVKSSANTTDGGAVGGTHNANAQNIGNGKTVEFQSGKNLVVNQTNDTTNGNATVEFSLSDNITVGKDGANGKDGSVGAKGADGSAVVMNGKDGSIGLNGTNGANGISIKGKDGANGVGIDGKDGITRIVYTEKVLDPANPGTTKEVTHEVATMDDGLKFTGNNTSTENKQKLGSLVKVQGEGTKESTAVDPATGKKYVVLSDGTTKFESAKDNIAVEADGTDTLTVKLNKNLKGLNSIQLGGNTIQSNGDNITFTTNGGTTKTVATTDQLWTIQANGTDVPAKAGKVNLVAGDHITITPDAANGKMTISATGFGSMDGFNVKSSASTGGTHAGDTTENIKNGKTVDMQAGKNLTVTQTNDGNGNTTVNYALNKDVDLGTTGSLKIGDTTINNGGLTIANGPSITSTGVDAGDKKITNVSDGAVTATSKDAVNGSQLKKYTDAAKTTVEAGDDNVNVETDNSAADGHTNYKVSLKPVVEIGDTHKVKIDGHTGDITGLTNVTLNDPTFATKGRAATEEQLKQVLTEAKNKAIEKVQAGTAAAGDTNIATVLPKAGDTFGAAGATYEVSVSKNAVKDAAKEAVKVTSVSPAITVTPDTSVAHETTYKVGFDGNQAATQIPLTYKQNGGNTRTVKLSDGLNFIDGTNTKARTAADGKVTFDVMGDLTGITSISNNATSGPKMTFGGSSINVTGGNLSMGDGTHNNKIVNVAPGTDGTDAVNLNQLNGVRTKVSPGRNVTVDEHPLAGGGIEYVVNAEPAGTVDLTNVNNRVDQLGEEVGRVGAQGAALSALKPIQYDPLEPTQIMAGYGNYRGTSAIAMGVAHYKNESTLIHGGISWAGGSSHMMANAGITWKVGNRDSEAAVADRYRKGPISSAYAMQQEMAAMKAQNAGLKGEVSDLKAENEQMKAQIAAMMAKLGL